MKAMQTCEEVVNEIAEHGKDRVTSVELHCSVNVSCNGVSKVSYYCRAWRSKGPINMPCSTSAYTLDELKQSMFKAITAYPTPDTDKQRQIDELEAQLKSLKNR